MPDNSAEQVSDPALVFTGDLEQPGTHVLLIGIGAYPFLEGGEHYESDKHEENAMEMGQLAAPPISMRDLGNWFLEKFDNPDRPLASLAMVISDEAPFVYSHPRIGADVQLPRGDIDDVERAVVAWTKRASTLRENGTIFAFCGHGVQSGDAILLCRDYGAVPENRFKGAINFEQFRISMSTNQPDTQLFLVDACRTPDMERELLGKRSPGNELLDAQSLLKRDGSPAAQSVHFATSLYTQAWGRDTGPSLFTEALIKALSGGAADQIQEWWITTGRLQSVLSTYLEKLGADEGITQKPQAQSQDFRITKPGQIAVDLFVRSEDPAIWDEALSLRAMRGNVEAAALDHAPDGSRPSYRQMEVVNPTQQFADVVYTVKAEFDRQSAFADCDAPVIAYPPSTTCDLPVRRRP